MKVFVLGCGEMGQEAIKDLYKYGKFKEIVVGTRTLEKAKEVFAELAGNNTKISARRIDLDDTAGLAELEDFMRGFDVIVNCAGPNYKYEVLTAQAAIKAKVNLVDINDDFETTFRMLELDNQAREAGITIILGLGASPGVNNILVRAAANQLDEIEEIHTAWVMSGADPGGLALSYHLLYSLSGKALSYQDGKLIEVQSFVDGKERIEFPDPVGEIDVFHIGHPEPITLSRCFPGVKYVDDKASFNPPFINDLIVNLGKMAREANGPVKVGNISIDAMDFAASYLHQRCKSLKGIPKDGALRVEVKGKKKQKARKIVFSSAGRISQGTGIPASIGAIMLAEGKINKTGVLPPEQCIEPNDFIFEMIDKRNVSKLNGWVEEIK
jgi:saccharopine dehydrogenase (NAD+, L-lysine-forming)